MANFDKAIIKTLENEGGDFITNDSTDRGGLTKYGISQKSYPEVDIANLTESNARDIYKRDYWDKVRGDDISSQSIADSIFDMAVNMGAHTSSKLCQRAIKGIDVDGQIGPVTISMLNILDERVFLYQFSNEVIKYYISIVTHNSSQGKYLLGWMNRALKITKGI